LKNRCDNCLLGRGSDHLSLARPFKANGTKLNVNEREALERGVKAKALQRLPPILMSKLNTIGFEKRG
jgi:hypothetical protein